MYQPFMITIHTFTKNFIQIDDDNSILEMVNQYCLSGRPWLDNSDIVLKNPIFREKWLLQNDDIILDRKLGKVVFL